MFFQKEVHCFWGKSGFIALLQIFLFLQYLFHEFYYDPWMDIFPIPLYRMIVIDKFDVVKWKRYVRFVSNWLKERATHKPWHRDILQGKISQRNFKCVYLSLFIITKLFLKSESLLLLKLNKLMVPKGKEPAPGDHESSLKIFLAKLFLARCPCATNLLSQILSV